MDPWWQVAHQGVYTYKLPSPFGTNRACGKEFGLYSPVGYPVGQNHHTPWDMPLGRITMLLYCGISYWARSPYTVRYPALTPPVALPVGDPLSRITIQLWDILFLVPRWHCPWGIHWTAWPYVSTVEYPSKQDHHALWDILPFFPRWHCPWGIHWAGSPYLSTVGYPAMQDHHKLWDILLLVHRWHCPWGIHWAGSPYLSTVGYPARQDHHKTLGKLFLVPPVALPVGVPLNRITIFLYRGISC